MPIGPSSASNCRLAEWALDNSSSGIELILVFDEQSNQQAFQRNTLINFLAMPFVRSISGTYGAPGLARNAGAELCQGEWIAFWDVDDLPNIEEILNALHSVKSNVDVLVGQFKITDARSHESSEGPIARNSKDLAINPGLWRVVFKRQSINGIKFSSGKMGEDQEFLIRTKYWEKNVEYIDENFYNYFTNQSQQLTSNPSNIVDLKEILIRTLIFFRIENKNEILQLFAARQLITLVKRGNAKLKISFLHELFSRFRFSAPNILLKLIFGVLQIFLLKART